MEHSLPTRDNTQRKSLRFSRRREIAHVISRDIPRFFLGLGTAVSIALLGLIIVLLLAGLGSLLHQLGAESLYAVFQAEWNPEQNNFGLLPMLANSLLLASFATVIAMPLCLGVTACMWGERPGLLHKWAGATLRFMVGIPTVVYSFCAFTLLVPLMRSFAGGTGLNLLTVSLTMALLILPTMALILDSALKQQFDPPSLLPLAAAAAGLTRQQLFWRIVLPTQKRWFATGALLAFGRALGDTMLPLMLAGNAPLMPDSPFSSIRTLAAHISLMTATQLDKQSELALFLAGTLLLGSSAAVNLCSKALAGRRL